MDDPERTTYAAPFAFAEGTHQWDGPAPKVPEQRFPGNVAIRLSEPRYGWPSDAGTNSTNDPEVFGPGGFIPMPTGPMAIEGEPDYGDAEVRYGSIDD